MRILLNGWFWGQATTGSGQYLGHLLANLGQAAPRHEIVLAVWRGHALSAKPPGCSVLPLSTPFDRVHENLSKLWFEQVAFPRACRRTAADLAHVPHWGSPLLPTVPTVVTIHDVIPLLLGAYRGGGLVRLYTRLVAASARRASGVITVSQASRQDIVSHLGLPEARVWVTHEAAPSSFRRAEPEQVAAVRQRYNLPERFFLYLGGFDVRKNVRGVLAAFAQGVEQEAYSDQALVIAGRLPERDSPFAPDPRRIARDLGIERRVRFTGWIDEADKPALYSAATVFVFPSHYEGFGLPVLEALACGAPAITSNVSSLPEVAGQGALLISPDDTTGLAAAMKQLWRDGGLRESLSKEGLAQAARFSWRQTAQTTAEVYDQIVGGSR